MAVDFIVGDESSTEWRMVLVEQGPWDDTEQSLRALQGRMYDCIDAALDGELAKKFPNSRNKTIIVQVDCYNLPQDRILAFFDEFSAGVFKTRDYAAAIENNAFVHGIGFELNFDTIH